MYDVTTSLINITIHIKPNISQNKANQVMKFGQLIEHDKYFF